MKKMMVCLIATLAVFLVACGNGGTEVAPWSTEQAAAILESGAFSTELVELDSDIAFQMYGLDDGGLTREQLTASAVYGSEGVNCEELAILIFDSEEAAKAALAALEDYVEGQIEENRDYRPSDIPKLEGKTLEQRGATLLLMVANDTAKANL